METVERTEHMLEDTLGALQHGSDAKISQDYGVLLIEGWLNALDGDLDLAVVRNELRDLQDELKKPAPNSSKVHCLLISLADHTTHAAKEASPAQPWASRLQTMAKALYAFSHQF